MILEWIRFIFTAVFLLSGVVIMVCAVVGTYRFGFALNRVHSAAMNDTLGLSLFLVGLAIASGSVPLILKFLLTIVFAWTTGSITSHMLAKLEYDTDDRLPNHCSLPDSYYTRSDDESKEDDEK